MNPTGKSNDSGIQDVGVKAQQKTEEIIDQVQEKVGDATGKVKEQATSQVSSQKDRAAEGLGNVAQAIRQTGDQLRQNDQVAPVAQYTDQLAQGVEMVSNYLRDHSVSDILGEVERFARREPALFLGGALTLGLLGGRFLRSSGNSDTQSQGNNNSTTSRMRSSGSGISGSGIYGSRSTGYSNQYPTDPVDNYSNYDLSLGTGAASEALPGQTSTNSGIYSGIPNSDTNRMGGSSSTSGTTDYLPDTYGTESSGRYGSQTGSSSRENGGPMGIA